MNARKVAVVFGCLAIAGVGAYLVWGRDGEPLTGRSTAADGVAAGRATLAPSPPGLGAAVQPVPERPVLHESGTPPLAVEPGTPRVIEGQRLAVIEPGETREPGGRKPSDSAGADDVRPVPVAAVVGAVSTALATVPGRPTSKVACVGDRCTVVVRADADAAAEITEALSTSPALQALADAVVLSRTANDRGEITFVLEGVGN